MSHDEKPSSGVSRRQFLYGSAAATFGMMVLGPLGSLVDVEAHASPASAPAAGLETWLLRTGHGTLDPALYQAVERHLA